MKVTAVCLLCLLLSAPVAAQQSEERQATEKKATVFLWLGISAAAASLAPLMAGAHSVGVPFLIGGGGMIGYAFYLNDKAKRLPTTTFVVAPVKRGVTVGVTRSW